MILLQVKSGGFLIDYGHTCFDFTKVLINQEGGRAWMYLAYVFNIFYWLRWFLIRSISISFILWELCNNLIKLNIRPCRKGKYQSTENINIGIKVDNSYQKSEELSRWHRHRKKLEQTDHDESGWIRSFQSRLPLQLMKATILAESS